MWLWLEPTHLGGEESGLFDFSDGAHLISLNGGGGIWEIKSDVWVGSWGGVRSVEAELHEETYNKERLVDRGKYN